MSDMTWIGSLDVMSWVQTQLQRETNAVAKRVQAEWAPLNQIEVSLSKKISAYNQLATDLSALQKSISDLDSAFSPTFQVSTSNSSVATAQESDSSAVFSGTHALTVSSLAKAEVYASGATGIASSTTVLGSSDTINVSLGSNNFSFTLDSATDTLETVVDKINTQAASNNIGVSASVISTTSGYKLMVSSTETGTSNAVSITDTQGGSDLYLNIAESVPAANASFTLDGQAMLSATNAVTINGITINLLSGGTANIVVNSSTKNSAIETAVGNVVNAYNQTITHIQEAQANGAADGNLSLILSTLQKTMGQGTYPYQELNSIGIAIAPAKVESTTFADGSSGSVYITGLLKVDGLPSGGPTLASALSSGVASVKSLLMDSTTGVFSAVNNLYAANTGAIWNNLNDPANGVLIDSNKKLTDIKSKEQEIKDNGATLQKNLVVKYANLEVMMQQIQTQSQYLTEQLAANKS